MNKETQNQARKGKKHELRKWQYGIVMLLVVIGILGNSYTVTASTGVEENCSFTMFKENNNNFCEEQQIIGNDLIIIMEQYYEKKEKERLDQLGREKARAEERSEARRQGIIEEKRIAREKAKAEAEAKERARKKAQKATFASVANEVNLLAGIIHCEAGNETVAEKVATGSVVLNRVRTTYKDFRNLHTIQAVLCQGNGIQYTTMDAVYGAKFTEEDLAVAKGLITGEIECLEEKVLFQNNARFVGDWTKNIEYIEIPGTIQYYAYPKDFEEGCK